MSAIRLSFEFFPPRSAAQQPRFWRTLGRLESLAPDFISVTWGALGTDSQASLEILGRLVKETDIPVAAHLTCAGMDTRQMHEALDKIEALGIRHIVALRGDDSSIVAGQRSTAAANPDLPDAAALVELINGRNGDGHAVTDISVAAYPETHPKAVGLKEDLAYLKRKLDAGGSRAITQFFFDAETFLRWRDKARAIGIEQPLVPGILPVHDIDKVIAFSQKCGASVPLSVAAPFQKAGSDAEHRSLAVAQSVELCQTLQREGVEDFHIYTLNQPDLGWQIGGTLLGFDLVRGRNSTASAAGSPQDVPPSAKSDKEKAA
ncbi:MAG: methylenetetrahydrofolate reductase [Granulosicoccus sp.]